MKPSDLPLYDDPPKANLEYVADKGNVLQVWISVFRKSVFKYFDSMSGASIRAREIYGTAVAHAKNSIDYVHDDSSVIARAGIISVAGLGGVVIGFRGGYLRKAVYASTGMAAAAAFCYPKQAANAARMGWFHTTENVNTVFKNALGSTKLNKNTVDHTIASEHPSTSSPLAEQSLTQTKDEDMYSTRES